MNDKPEERVTHQVFVDNHLNELNTVNSFGKTWWNCPYSNRRCKITCEYFLKAYIKYGVIHGFRCIKDLANKSLGFHRKSERRKVITPMRREKERLSRNILNKDLLFKLDELNSFGKPWWYCPYTNRRCEIICEYFLKARIEDNKIKNFKCGKD